MTELREDEPTLGVSRLGFALIALALGGFTLGTTEFVTMGILPEVAESIGKDIPTTGHMITAYAFGVVVGAPLIVACAARLPRRGLAIALVLAMALGNGLTAVADGYHQILAARFVAGLPHGAYFGVASLLAASMVPPAMKGRAVSAVMMGLSAATLAGVPLSAALGQHLGWRASYVVVVFTALASAAMLMAFVPASPGDPTATVRRELNALVRPPVIAALLAGAIGFGGLFAMYSYIAPIVTDVTGLGKQWIPVYLLIFGIGSMAGTWWAGILADRNNVAQIVGGFIATVVTLVLFWFTAQWAVFAALGVFAIAALGSIVAIGLQLRLMHAAGDAQMLGAALNHSSLNIANGLGAWLGGLVIAAGAGLLAPALVGAALASAGLVVFVLGLRYAPAD